MSEFLNMLALIDFLEALISPEIGINIYDVDVGTSIRRKHACDHGFTVTLHACDDFIQAVSIALNHPDNVEELQFDHYSIKDTAQRIEEFVNRNELDDTLPREHDVINIGRAMEIYKQQEAINVALPAVVTTNVGANHVDYTCHDGYDGEIVIRYYPFDNVAEVKIGVGGIDDESKAGREDYAEQMRLHLGAMRFSTTRFGSPESPIAATAELLYSPYHSGTGLTDFWDIYPSTQLILVALRGNLPKLDAKVQNES